MQGVARGGGGSPRFMGGEAGAQRAAGTLWEHDPRPCVGVSSLPHDARGLSTRELTHAQAR